MHNSFYKDLDLILSEELEEKSSLIATYYSLSEIFTMVVQTAVKDSVETFSGMAAMLDYVFKVYPLDRVHFRPLQNFRSFVRQFPKRDNDTEEQVFLETLKSRLPDDVRCIAHLIQAVYNCPIPSFLSQKLVRTYQRIPFHKGRLLSSYLRVVVNSVDEQFIYCSVLNEEEPEELKVKYDFEFYSGCNWNYLKTILVPYSQLNLIKPRKEEGVVFPEMIIFQPDYLVDISAIASCFKPYGNNFLNRLIDRIRPKETTVPILLGKFAGQLLDEALHSLLIDYKTSVKTFFKTNAVDIALIDEEDLMDFHQAAKVQMANIQQFFQRQQFLGREESRLNLQVEPSFFSEMLGLQGRMDLLSFSSVHTFVFEQKSGKMDEYHGKMREEHYVQILLYMLLLHYNYDLSYEQQMSCYLFYSKYDLSQGLIRITNAPQLLFEAIRLRNLMVAAEFRYAKGEAANILLELQPENLREKISEDSILWTEYVLPELSQTLSLIQQADDLSKAYYFRFLQFLHQEHLLAKVGSPTKLGSGFASSWHTAMMDKIAQGNLFVDLNIVDFLDKNENPIAENSPIDYVVFQQKEWSFDENISNFRKGDIVVFYRYSIDAEPNICQQMVVRGVLKEFLPNGKILVQLRASQSNPKVLNNEKGFAWAMEHDFLESSQSVLYSVLYSILEANEERRSLLLTKRLPEVDLSCSLIGNYDKKGENYYNSLVRKAIQAKDYFLLVGPPGTGKTSRGLMYILQEQLLQSDLPILLTAYTNRAVDEICDKLVAYNQANSDSPIEFLRLGSRSATDNFYASYFLAQKVEDNCKTKAEVIDLLKKTRVFVGTTSSVLANLRLTKLLHFSMAIVDEASQLIEPQMVGLFCAKDGEGNNAIDKFVLIGDYKQLPAVVLQTEKQSAVTDSLLQEIGLQNCRNSLFERLYCRNTNSDIVFVMTRQGRMHKQVSGFSNEKFYGGELKPLLARQKKALRFSVYDEKSKLFSLLATNRTAFISVEQEKKILSDKVNRAEARLIAQMVIAVKTLYLKNDKEFLADQTIGVIVPYRNQISAIRSELQNFDCEEYNEITIDTVERFQGSERDVIIYGFTIQRAYQLSFLTSNVILENNQLIDRKLNVALTRAREQLFVVGNVDLLSQFPLFKQLVDDYESKGLLFDSNDLEF